MSSLNMGGTHLNQKGSGRLRVAGTLIALGSLLTALTQPSVAQEVSEDTAIPGRSQPIVTTPRALSQGAASGQTINPLSPSFIISGGSSLPRAQDSTSGIPSSTSTKMPGQLIDSAPWVLTPDQTPWPLNYAETSSQTRLMVLLPSPQEVKLMMPGQALDVVDRAAQGVNKYLQDALGVARQIRSQQLEQVNSWVEKTSVQRASLPNALWPVYQFTQDARGKALQFRERVQKQSEPLLKRSQKEAQEFILKLSELMETMPTHEAKTALYNVMVRLRDGVTTLHAQIQQDDDHVLRAIDLLLKQLPAMPRPDHPPPPESSAPLGGGWVGPTTNPMKAPIPAQQAPEPTTVATVSPPQREVHPTREEDDRSAIQDQGGSLLSYLVMAIVGLGVVSMIGRRRKRKSTVDK